MNKIEKLIEELCPQGVAFRAFQDLLDHKIIYTVSPPKKLTKKHYKSSGEFPIIDQGQSFIVGYTNNRNLIVDDGEYVVFGDHTEAIKYVDFPFAQGADGIKILKTKGLLAKYLYYALNNFYTKTGKYTRHFSFLKKLQIPIPPLAIQKEIVAILDKFDALVNDISTGLPAEITARKKQYEYYRNQLLTFKPLEAQKEKQKNSILIYKTEDGKTDITVRLENEDVWLSQQQMAELYQTSRTNVVEHIKHIFEEEELAEEATCRNFRQVQEEGGRNVEREIPF